MSQKGGQHGGAHYRTHAESSRPKPGLNPNLSVSSKSTQKVFQDCLAATTDSQLPNGNTTVDAFQDGDRGTESYSIEAVGEQQHNNRTGRSPSVFSLSNSVLHRATKRQKRRSVGNTSVQSQRGNNIRSNRIVTTQKQKRKKKLEQVNNKSNLIDSNCESSDISNNSIIVIERLNYLSSEPSSSDDDDEEEVADGDDEAEHEIEDLHSYGEHSVAGSNGEWLKSRIRNLNSVVDFNLDQSHTDDQEVVDSLEELGSTSKAAKDIVVDEFFADEHLAVSPEEPGSVMPPLTGAEHVLVPPTTESIALYNNNNKHATDTEDIVTTSGTSPDRSRTAKISVAVGDIETGSTSRLSQITPPPDSSPTSTNTPSATTTNVFLVDNSEEPCSSSFPGLSSSSYSTTTTSNSSSLEASLLEFRRVGTDKSNTLMTPQELESMPDQGIEFEESVGPKQEVISPSSLTTCSTTSPSSSLSLSDSLSVLSDSPQSHQKLLASSSLLESPSRTTTPTPNNNNTNIITTDHSSNHDVKPIFIDSSSTSTGLTSSADSTSTTTTTAGLDSSLLNAGNFTLATISISTDRATNSTQILVNTNQGQQLYHINTADLTQPLSLPVTQAPPTTPSSSATTATRTTSASAPLSTSSQTNGPSAQTGYLLLPVNPAENGNSFLMTVPMTNGNVKQQPSKVEWSSVVKEESDDDTGSKSDSPSENTPVKKLWSCQQAGCEQVFKKLSKLKIHLMRHTGERPFRCNQPGCDWAFTTAYKLKRHVESHQGRKDYICDIDGCGRKFTTIYNLNSHKKLHERPCNEVCPKPNCNQRYPTKRQLDLHLKNHADVEKTYKCPVDGCNKVFLSPNCMGSHARVHQQDRDDLVCKYDGCGKVFNKVCRLKQHMRCHTGEKPYQCRVDGCSWAFATASKLKRHMSKHTGVRKWLCNACGKAFLRAEHLKGHLVTHSGTKPFQCPVDGCKTRFTAKSSLYIHLKKHDHSGKKITYHCPMEGCEKKYSTKVSLRNHIMKHYNNSTISASDSPHFDLVPLLGSDDISDAGLESLGQHSQSENQTTPVSGVNLTNSLSNSILGSTDPVLVGPSDYMSTDSEKLLSVAVNSASLFSSSDNLPPHGITLRDPETGVTYVQTQLLQDDPPNPEMYPGDGSLVTDLALHDASSNTAADSASEHGASSTEFTGTTINLQDLE
ncbi:finger ZXDC-like [Octopus vulgaris]|uniref:Finger ZXDC-like n=1 Tax=Octopus vulgaris TaxID=6645 RepID=A0AA36BT26_OCTVU|nr:finger ZXDC-like [Octopus vulgaris]